MEANYPNRTGGSRAKRLLARAVLSAVLLSLWSCMNTPESTDGQADAGGRGSSRKASIEPQDRFLWSCYMICFGINRDYTGSFYDRPLERPTEGMHPRLVDLRNAAAAGVDALSVDLFILDKYAHPAFGQLVQLIEEHDLPLKLSPMFDGFGRPGLTEAQVISKVQEWFESFGQKDCVVRTGGKPVILTFGAGSLAPDTWKRIFAALRQAGHEGHWIFDGGGPLCLGPEPKFDQRAPWLDMFDGAYTFAPGRVPERPIANARIYGQRYGELGKVWVGSTKTGYWRPEIAVVTSPLGTLHYRESWDAIQQAHIPWVQQATWNDFSESHGIMPSANKSTTFTELTRFLARAWRGERNDLTAPRVFLSRMREVQLGEEMLLEVLALLPTGTSSASVALTVVDGAGAVVHAAEQRVPATKGLVAPHFAFRVSDLPAGRVLKPRATVRVGKDNPIVTHGQPTIVTRDGFHPERCYSWVYEPAHRQLLDTTMRLILPDGPSRGQTPAPPTTKAEAAVTAQSPLVDVEILHNGKPIYVVRRKTPDAFPCETLTHRAELPLNRAGRLDWGFYQLRATTEDRRVAVSDPVFVEPPPGPKNLVGLWTFDHGTDYRVIDESPWMRDGRLGARTHYPEHQPQRVPDGRGGQCVRFDGVDDRIQMDGPVVPRKAFTVECRVKPETWGWPGKDEGALIMGCANADVVVILRKNGTLAVSRKADKGWTVINDTKAIPLNQWTHVAVTFDGTRVTLYRDGHAAGSMEAPGQKGISRFGVGFNTVTHGSFYHGCIDDIRIREGVHPPKNKAH